MTWLAHAGGAQYHCATECQPTQVCTINPAPFTTGFNDRNVETHAEWFDPAVHFTPKAAIQDFQTAMANGMQYDPKLM